MTSKTQNGQTVTAENQITQNQNFDSEALNYSEIPGLTSPAVDVLNQFQSNLKLLGDLHFKLHFVMSEIKGTLRK